MSITVAEVITNFNTFLGDTSTDRVSSAERLQYITEATSWLKEEVDNDYAVKTYSIKYFDTVNYYKLNPGISDVFEGNDLRRAVGENDISFTRKSSREMAEDIAQQSMESCYSIERRDGNAYLVVNHDSKYSAMVVSQLESLTADGGTWTADTSTSDATNLAVNNNDFTEGDGCLSFDVDVSQSGNNKAGIYNTDLSAEDLTDSLDLDYFLLDIQFPDVTYITSVKLYWGSDTSNYYSVTVTTDINGSAFVASPTFNTLKFAWLGSTITGTPDITAINYIRIEVNYSASQADATSFKIDNLRLVRPEILTFYYASWNVGTNSSGTELKAFTATSDIPYFSGQYDDLKYAVAHKAVSLCFKNLRLYGEADKEELESLKQVNKIKKIIPKSRTPEEKNFKVRGIRFSRGGFRGKFVR